MSSPKRKVHFISLGCPKNLVDSEIMVANLQQGDYEIVENSEEADALVVNTCGFIEDAKRESLSTILEAAELKEKGQLKKLVVAGCLTQRYKEELVKDLPEADLFVGSGEFQNLHEILNKSFAGATEKKFFNLPTYLQQEDTPRINSDLPHRAYLKISEGCKKRCSFCAIPHIRGNLQSRTIQNVLSEAKLLVAGGTKELIVISHDFTDYGWDLRKNSSENIESPIELLRTLADESGAQWIRVLYLYPDGIDSEMIDLVKSKPNLLSYFDMPLQHINNRMLKLMNRRMKSSEIKDAIARIRREIPEAILRTQFIVGFPGETDEEFAELLEFIRESEFDRVGCFKYSDEEGTRAAELPDKISAEVKQERFDALMAMQKSISQKKQQEWVGKTISVIVDGLSEETNLLLKGRFYGQAPDIDGITYINDGQAKPGDIVNVQISEAHDYDLVGAIESPRL